MLLMPRSGNLLVLYTANSRDSLDDHSKETLSQPALRESTQTAVATLLLLIRSRC
ncbi:hypothetical protein CDEST_00965 [Colletotrichum destructivum]|uniref:Uncharacterized protein n=1 Tax=Colletotrichum destructivum TaxID=34406 RepID=A0AAX4HXN8_9PEZI|nr:hypothetical protein CDEST_00965 [Colletotrichum destructivum]